MASNRRLNLHLAADRADFSNLLAEQGIRLEHDAITYAVSKLSDDWLIAWASSVFNIRTSESGTSGIGLPSWADTIRSVFEMRGVAGTEEQIRRLCIPSHEALDTQLVVRVAGKYHRCGFSVAFEPNGAACSDLLIEGQGFRSYVEIKRENQADHKRYQSVTKASAAILSRAEPEIRGWLEDRELRMELKLSKAFSLSVAPSVVKELKASLQTLAPGDEHVLATVPGSRYVLLTRKHPLFYEKGIHTGRIVVKRAGTPVQVTPQNAPILVVFDWQPNLKALKRRLRQAAKQLRGDAAKDANAEGFIVLEMSHGELATDVVVRCFSSLPENCLGVVLRSDPSYLVRRSDLSPAAAKVLMLAGPS